MIRDKLIQVQENTGSLTIPNVDLKDEGRIFYVMAMDSAAQPASIWPSYNLEVLEEKAAFGSLQIRVNVKVARQEGTREQLIIYCGDQGEPFEVTGAKLKEYRAEDKTAVLLVELPPLEDVTGQPGKEVPVTVRF